MTLRQKAFKYKLKPTTEQADQINRTFGCARFVFNRFLARRSDSYKADGKSLTYNATSAELTVVKAAEETKWLRDVDKFALQNSLKDLDRAFSNFFRDAKKPEAQRKFHYPNFKSKHSPDHSYRTNLTNGNIAVEGNRIKLPKLGWVKFVNSREPSGKIISVTVARDGRGKYSISVLCETEVTPYSVNTKAVGIDLGLKTFYVPSEGDPVENPRHYRSALKRLKKAQRTLSRRKKGSARRQKAKTKLAGIHARVADLRRDFLHKSSTTLVRQFGFIGVEDLKITNMVKNHRLAQGVMDVGWGEFVRQLEYKCLWYGRTFQRVGAWFPSSQMCHDCGFKNPVVKELSVRHWVCPHCGESHDRDLNAALNIRVEALRIVAAGLSETLNAHGDRVRRPSNGAAVVELGIPSLQ